MLNFSDTPYKYYPPKPSRPAIWFFQLFNRYFYLPGSKHRVKGVTMVNPEVLNSIRRFRSRRILFLPNHPSHSDPQIILEAQRQTGIPSMFIAAYDTFERNKLHAWVMQKSGAFSVDRDGNDSQSIKQAIQTLTQGRYALTVFPEGNIYFMNDRVTPFLEGAAYIGMKAQKETGSAPVYAVPVSIKLTLLEDERDKISGRIIQLAKEAGVELNSGADLINGLKRVGIEILKKNLRQRGYFSEEPAAKDLSAYLKQAAEIIIVGLEKKMELNGKKQQGDLIDRVRKIRRAIHHIRTHNERKADHAVAAAWADEAILAFRILSYSGQYLEENPTLDRFGETVEKLLEDLYSEAQAPYGVRHAYVYFSEPVNLADHLGLFNSKPRETLQGLTQTFENSVQTGLDILNRNNPHPGGQRFMD